MNRGSSLEQRIEAALERGFNEAPIHESGKSQERRAVDGAAETASMRPRFMNRGSALFTFRAHKDAPASMRPRFMNRGSTAPEQDCPQIAHASMRPRFMNRGSNYH